MNDMVMLALTTAGVIIVIGFLGSYLFDRTGLPDMIFLIILGVIFGPILRFFDPASITELAPYLAALALVFILFDGGLRMNIYEIFSETPRAELLAIVSFVLSVTTITLFAYFLMGIPLLYGILFGSISGGGSSIVVVSLAKRIRVSEKCATTIVLEGAISDILCIVVSLSVIGIILTGQADYTLVSKEIAAQFSIGAVVGIIFGVFWLSIFKMIASASYGYMLTLAIVLLAYTISEYLGGSGPLSSLLFGVMLGNEKDIFKFLKRGEKRDPCIDEGMKRFESEIAFLIKTFFFVYLGLIAVITNINMLILGIILSFLLLLVRYVAVRVATVRGPFTRDERNTMSVVLTRGLEAAALSTLPIQYGLLYADLYLSLTLVIIITTAIICTIGVIALSRK